MVSALGRKPWRDLMRHKVRTSLAVLTIAATVAGVWLLAIPTGIGESMRTRAEIDRLDDILIKPMSLWHGARPEEAAISVEELDGLRHLPGVEGVLASAVYWTDVRIGDRTERALIVGLADLAQASVNRISVREGALPAWGGEELLVLSETANARNGRFDGSAGAAMEIRAGDGVFYPATVTGRGSTLRWTENVGHGQVVLYAPIEFVHLFTATEGFNAIQIRSRERTPEALDDVLASARAHLAAVAPDAEYWGVTEVRDPDTWPGKENIDRFVPMLYVLAAVALASAMVLVATTMTTLVREQRRDIGIMKALGAGRRVVARSLLTSAVLIGVAGTVIGVGAGLLTSRALGEYTTVQLLGIDSVWAVDPAMVVLSILLGIGGTALAAMPAVRRATTIAVHEIVSNPGIDTGFGSSRLERTVANATRVPRLARIGIANAVRTRRRTIATAVQIALGVGTAVAFAAFGVTGITVSNETMSNESGDIRVTWMRGGPPLDERAAAVAAVVDGVAKVQPVIYGAVQFAGDDRTAWGLTADPIYDHDLTSGRWFTPDEAASGAAVAVLGGPMAEIAGVAVGDTIEIEARAGVRSVEVVGIDRTLVSDGQYVWLPLQTAAAFHEAALDYALWVDTTSRDPDDITGVGTGLGAALADAGYQTRIGLHHEELAEAQAEDRIVVGLVMLIGLPIVAIGMIGLVSAMTTSVLERTREIGMLRSIGARRRHVRRLLRAEGTTVAVLGWLLGIPVGYALARLIVWRFAEAMHATIDVVFPWWLIPAALVLAVIAARLTLRLPIRRAVRMTPSEALRYL